MATAAVQVSSCSPTVLGDSMVTLVSTSPATVVVKFRLCPASVRVKRTSPAGKAPVSWQVAVLVVPISRRDGAWSCGGSGRAAGTRHHQDHGSQWPDTHRVPVRTWSCREGFRHGRGHWVKVGRDSGMGKGLEFRSSAGQSQRDWDGTGWEQMGMGTGMGTGLQWDWGGDGKRTWMGLGRGWEEDWDENGKGMETGVGIGMAQRRGLGTGIGLGCD